MKVDGDIISFNRDIKKNVRFGLYVCVCVCDIVRRPAETLGHCCEVREELGSEVRNC